MAKPSILTNAGAEMLSSVDGRFLLNNGKHVVLALQRVAEESEAKSLTLAEEDWVVEDLLETFEVGLHCDFVEYPDPTDRDSQVVAVIDTVRPAPLVYIVYRMYIHI